MTEKRYSFNVNKMTIEKDGKYFAYTTVEHSKIVNELNTLYEEKEELINSLNKKTEQCNNFIENNAELVAERNKMIKILQIIFDRNKLINEKEAIDLLKELYEKNQELKKENMEYYRLVNCGNCKYHDYDWFDDGDEFEVCDKGNTERLMYNKFCKEWVKND